MNTKHITWIKAAGVRALKTVAQTAVATIGTCAVLDEVNWIMVGSAALCIVSYLLAVLMKNPLLALLGCSLCGLSVGIMWPGTISISSRRMPYGGTAMFALLAMAGDLGGAFGPGIAGAVTQACGDNLQKGMLAGSVFPLVLVICVLALRRTKKV